jgi:5-deoxy-glucuronate isomerase
MVIPLSGSVVVEHRGENASTREREQVELSGRESVFDGPSDVVYLGAGVSATLTGTGRVAVAEASATRSLPVQVMRAGEVPVEIRGAGRCTRQVHNFGTPGGLDAQNLIVCEVITPSENWSSYPPHKHDEAVPGVESQLEEIYYFESEEGREFGTPAAADPFGLFAAYSSPAGDIRTNTIVRTGDIALVPFGYHGPAVASPGYDLYYLNVMAGPDPERAWNIRDDPAHRWLRDTWPEQATDPRLPYRPSTPNDPQGVQR